jgi:hypothetical protein
VIKPVSLEECTAAAKKLSDQGKLVEAGWLGFRWFVLPPDASQLQVEEMRKAFFGGAAHRNHHPLVHRRGPLQTARAQPRQPHPRRTPTRVVRSRRPVRQVRAEARSMKPPMNRILRLVPGVTGFVLFVVMLVGSLCYWLGQ